MEKRKICTASLIFKFKEIFFDSTRKMHSSPNLLKMISDFFVEINKFSHLIDPKNVTVNIIYEYRLSFALNSKFE